jgi:hypothetical protein
MNPKSAFIAAALLAALPAFAQAPAAAPAPKPATTAPAQASASSAQPIDPAKAAAVRQLMDVTGSNKLGDELVTLLTSQVKQAAGTRISDADRLNTFMAAFSKNYSTRITAAQIDEAVIPIYADHLSLDDIQALVTFYKSPAGQNVIKALPLIIQDSQNTGAAMARPAAIDTLRQMSADYPEIASLIPANNTAPPSQGVQPDSTPAQPGSAPSLRQIPTPAH